MVKRKTNRSWTNTRKNYLYKQFLNFIFIKKKRYLKPLKWNPLQCLLDNYTRSDVLWFGPLAAGLSPKRSSFKPKPENPTLCDQFSSNNSPFPSQHHSTSAPHSFILPFNYHWRYIILALYNIVNATLKNLFATVLVSCFAAPFKFTRVQR